MGRLTVNSGWQTLGLPVQLVDPASSKTRTEREAGRMALT